METSLNTVPAGAAILVVYKHYITVNRRAMDILGISDRMPYICFYRTNGRISVAGTASPAGHMVRVRSHCGRISSTSLAYWLAHQLQGPGTYRIQEEYVVHNPTGEQHPCYEIFFRKYQNQRDYADKIETQAPAAATVADESEGYKA